MRLLFGTVILLFASGCFVAYRTMDGGKAWEDQPQLIPGRVQCEFYNQGNEGVAYHTTDSLNYGSGKLNPVDGNWLNEFRMGENVSISYTKAHGIDDNPYNRVKQAMNQLYVGWTKPGEWINYTVKVEKTRRYKLGLMYTANGNGTISLDVDGKNKTGPIKVPSTHDDHDPIAWRQWHHWNKLDDLATIHLTKGKHVLTLRVLDNGNMNFDYLEFE